MIPFAFNLIIFNYYTYFPSTYIINQSITQIRNQNSHDNDDNPETNNDNIEYIDVNKKNHQRLIKLCY